MLTFQKETVNKSSKLLKNNVFTYFHIIVILQRLFHKQNNIFYNALSIAPKIISAHFNKGRLLLQLHVMHLWDS